MDLFYVSMATITMAHVAVNLNPCLIWLPYLKLKPGSTKNPLFFVNHFVFYSRILAKAALIDTRTPSFYKKGHTSPLRF